MTLQGEHLELWAQFIPKLNWSLVLVNNYYCNNKANNTETENLYLL